MIPDGRDAPPAGTLAWRLSGASLDWFAEDGEAIVFNPVSGRTHRLDAAASLLFSQLAGGAMGLDELKASLAARWRVPTGEVDGDAVLEVLGALEAAGLAEREVS